MSARSWIVATLAVCAACGDTAGTGATGGVGGQAGGEEGGGGAPPAMYTFTVNVLHFPTNRPLATGPEVGIQVFADLEDGTHIEAVTDEQGNAEFAIPDGTENQRVDILIFRPGEPFLAFVDQDLPTLNINAWFIAPPDEDVRISGIAMGSADPATDLLTLTTTADGGDFYQSTSENWHIDVVAGEPFGLVGLDWSIPSPSPVSPRGVAQDFHAWTVVDSPALQENTTIAIDFAARAATPVAFQGSFDVPPGNGLLSQTGIGYASVVCGGLEGYGQGISFCGAPTRLDINADGSRFEYVGEYVETPGTSSTVYAVFGTDAGTYLVADGYPTDGPQDFVLLPLPEIVAPATGIVEWGATIEWAPNELYAECSAGLFIYDDSDSLGGRIFGRTGATEVKWPALPPDVDPAAFAGGSAYAYLLERSDLTAVAGPHNEHIHQVDLIVSELIVP